MSDLAAVPGPAWLPHSSQGFMRVDQGVQTDRAMKGSGFFESLC